LIFFIDIDIVSNNISKIKLFIFVFKLLESLLNLNFILIISTDKKYKIYIL